MLNVLEIFVSAEGAVIVIVIALLIVFLVVVYGPSERIGALKLDLLRGKFEHEPKVTDDTQALAARGTAPAAQGSQPTIKPELSSDEAHDVEETKDDDNPFIGMLRAAKEGDETKLESEYQRYLKEKPEASREDSACWRVHLRRQIGIPGAVIEYKSLEEENPDWVEPSRKLAHFYFKTSALELAHQHLETGFQRANTNEKKGPLVLLKADLLKEEGKVGKALSILYEFAQDVDERDLKSTTYQKIADIYESLGDTERMTVALEKALSIDPDNTAHRYRLAFEYGKTENLGLLSCFHYRVLLLQEPNHATALNNYGAQLEDLGAQAETIRLWKRGVEMAETDYPAGNIAIKLANAGFLAEAEEFLNELTAEQRAGERARYATEIIQKKRAENSEKVETIEAEARSYHDSIRDLLEKNEIEELRTLSVGKLAGTWQQDNDVKLALTANSGVLSGEWKTPNNIYDVRGNKIGALIILEATETKRLIGGFGALLTGSSSSEPYWADITSNPMKFNLRLVIHSDGHLEGVRTEDGNKLKKCILTRE